MELLMFFFLHNFYPKTVQRGQNILSDESLEILFYLLIAINIPVWIQEFGTWPTYLIIQLAFTSNNE